MTNEEFQKVVLDELKSIRKEMTTKDDLDRITTEQQKDITAVLDIVNRKLDNLPTREELHSAIAGQQKDIIATLQLMEKKLDSTDVIDRIETKIDILSHRVLAQDGEIQLLKQAK